MAYENTSAEFRPELQVKVEEAMLIDNKFLADLIFPIYPVTTRKGYYKRIKRGKGQLLSNPSAGKTDANDPLLRAPGTAYREVTRTTEQDSWLCKDRGLEEALDDVNKQEESRFFDIESSTAIWLMRQIRIAREARVAAMIFNESIWGTPVASTTAFIAANRATIDPAELIKEAKRAVDKRQEQPNTLCVSSEMWDLISGATKFREYFFGTAGGSAMITKEMVAEKFELSQILVGRASYDTTKPGKDSDDSNLVWTWGNDYMWIGQVTDGAPEMGGAGRTMVLEELTNGQLFVTETYREEKIRSDRLRVRSDDESKIVNENAGILVKINNL
jgi:hypothetical protein